MIARQGRQRAQRDRHLEQRDGVGEAVVLVEEMISLARPLVALALEALRLGFALLLVDGVALLLLEQVCRRVLPLGLPGRLRGLRYGELDPLRLIIRPLI